MKEVLNGFKDWLKTQYGCPVIIEPQRQDLKEPRWRLTLGGVSKQGEKRRVLTITGTIQADGGDPNMTSPLLSLIEKNAELEITEKAFEFPYTLPGGVYKAKASFTSSGEGGWTENDEEANYPFSYMEQYRISLSYNPDYK